jgi:excinuclease ABC subunit C
MAEPPKDLEPEIEFEDDEQESTLPQVDEGSADLDVPSGTAAAGLPVIARYAKLAPASPGVYRMIDSNGEVLYVGKAKHLRKRILAYQRPTGHNTRIARMIAASAAIEFVSTATETEALLLEANLIKRLRPRFNVLLRDDKSFPYILISGDHPAPQICKHRGSRSSAGDYFGPFASVWAVNRTITALERAFLIRSCSDAVFESRTRPCLLFQIKRCSGPCTAEIAPDDYAELVREAKTFLSGKSRMVKEELAAEMERASSALDFERAAVYRDRLAALSAIQAHQGINPRSLEEADVFAVHQEAGFSCVEVFFFRTGQNWGNRAYFPRADRSLPAEEILGSFLAQFYDDKPCPRLVLISHEIEDRALIADALTIKSARRVDVMVPQRGEKKELVEHALANAREALGRKLAETSSQHRLLKALAGAFSLPRPPQRIEVYDNSHIQGSNAVGAMIVAGPEGFCKKAYRKFNIRSAELAPGDDYGMMREVLTRRFRRLIAETGRTAARPSPGSYAANATAVQGAAAPVENGVEPFLNSSLERAPGEAFLAASTASGPDRGLNCATAESAEQGPDESRQEDQETSWPDLLLIDGGRGQLNAAQEILSLLGVTDLPLVAIAKGQDRNAGQETFFMGSRPPFNLKPRDPVLYFVQRLRDEAHRFAVGSHRQRRKRDLREGGLQEIPGIGPARKRALLRHFGTLRAVERASIADLEHVPGINAETARKVYDFLHEIPAKH